MLSTSMKVAPRLMTCSLAAGLTSKAKTLAPIRLAVAMAWRPATPAPRITTLAGFIEPAAVIIIGIERFNAYIPSITAL